MSRARILVLSYTSFASSPRPYKQVDALKGSHHVTTAGFGAAPFDDVEHVELPRIAPQRWGLLGRLLNLVALVLRAFPLVQPLRALDREVHRLLGGREWDLVIAHDIQTLIIAEQLRPRYGVVLDLHEYAPRENEQIASWRMLIAPYVRWMCRRHVPRAAAIITVGRGIADEYRNQFGIDSEVVPNVTPYQELSPQPVGRPVRLVHSGVAAIERGIDIIIRGVLASRAEVTLDLFLVGSDAQLATLRDMAGSDPRIRFNEPMPYRRLVQALNGYDVGVHILPPVNFNHVWALPNKFFDFVQARLGVLIGPSAEMARYVQEAGFGEVVRDFTPAALAESIDRLDGEQIRAWKYAADAHARELSSERYEPFWPELVERLTTGR